MDIIKPVAVFIKNRKYLVARDTNEEFFKNVGGRIKEGESDVDCLKRNLASEIGFTLEDEAIVLFEFPPTPAQGDPGDLVILRGYLVGKDLGIAYTPGGDVAELAWVDSNNQHEYNLTPQIKELILPKLQELDLID